MRVESLEFSIIEWLVDTIYDNKTLSVSKATVIRINVSAKLWTLTSVYKQANYQNEILLLSNS